MAGRSSILVIVLAFGVLGSMLYVSSFQTSNNRIAHDWKVIPTEPKISQLQAVETVEKHIHSKVQGVQQIGLFYSFYNSSNGISDFRNSNNAELTNLGWNFEYVKAHPEPLNLLLAFIHANGTIYGINATNHSYLKACDLSSSLSSYLCPMDRNGANAARDRLVYSIEVNWSPPIAQEPYHEGHYLIDAETGKIVWDNIDFAAYRKPLPNVNFDNKTVSQLQNELANPLQTTNIDIEQGASDQSANKGYLPKEVRVALGMNNRVVWTNRDTVPESVVSDSGYVDKLTGKKFESGLIPLGGTFEFTFTKEGEYSYHAEPHPWMRGKIEVVESFA